MCFPKKAFITFNKLKFMANETLLKAGTKCVCFLTNLRHVYVTINRNELKVAKMPEVDL